MNIVIAGTGSVGELLTDELSEKNQNVTVIDLERKKLERLVKKNDVSGVVGNCVSQDILKLAGMKECDIYIAVTNHDEQNIISSLIAKKLGAKNTIVRIEDPNYAEQISFLQDELEIDALINSEKEAAHAIFQTLRFPWASSIENFANNRLKIAQIHMDENNILVGKQVSQIHKIQDKVAVCAIVRENGTIIPDGKQLIKAHDDLLVIGETKRLTYFKDQLHIAADKISSVLILGGGGISDYLIESLLATKMSVKVIEKNLELAEYLSEKYPKCLVIEGDGTDRELLKEERIDTYNAVIALMKIDEENIISSLSVLKDHPEKKVVTKVDRTDLLKIVGTDRLRTVITPKQLVANKIIRFLRSKTGDGSSYFESYFQMAGNEAEAIQFEVSHKAKIIGKTLAETNLHENVMIAYIIRKDKLLLPRGNDRIEAGDRIIVVTTNPDYDDIDDILV